MTTPKHVHKWRRLTAKELAGGWYCTHIGCLGKETKAVWCCGDEPTGVGGSRVCYDGRCAKHGPKPKRRKTKERSAFCHDCKGEVIYEPVLCEACARVRAEEGMSREDPRTIAAWRKS